MANGGIIGPVKVVCTPSTKVTSFTSSGTFQKFCTSTYTEIMVVAGAGGGAGSGWSWWWRCWWLSYWHLCSMPNAAL